MHNLPWLYARTAEQLAQARLTVRAQCIKQHNRSVLRRAAKAARKRQKQARRKQR